MRKTDKKTDNQLRIVLTELCETTLKEIKGFKWITHLVNYNNFPTSLKIVCIFDHQDHLKSFIESHHNIDLTGLLENKLLAIGIKLNNISKHISYDCQE